MPSNDPNQTTIRFNNLFNLPFLPPRHRPITISKPFLLPPPSYPNPSNPTLVSASATVSVSEYEGVSPVSSVYPDLGNVRSPGILESWTTPITAPPNSISPTPINTNSPSFSPSRPIKRPPPLDLSKTREAFPGSRGVKAIPAGTTESMRVGDEKQQIASDTESANPQPPFRPIALPKKEKTKTIVDDPFDVVEVEPGHRYASWRGGKVDIRPGQIIPSGVLAMGVRSDTPSQSRETLASEINGEVYESVLHNILLTPTYLPSPSTAVSSTSDPSRSKRKTLLGNVVNMARRSGIVPKSILRPFHPDPSLASMRTREAREMDKFKSDVRLAPTSAGWATGSTLTPVREGSRVFARKSPAAREWSMGMGADSDMKGEGRSWRERKRQEERDKTRSRKYKFAAAILLICLVALTIGLCTSLLTRKSAPESISTTGEANTTATSSEPTQTSSTSSSAASAPLSTTTSQSLKTCLDQYASTGTTSPTTYPCSDCVPLLTAAANDFEDPSGSVGVGSALQFCALMDIWRSTNIPGWVSGSACTWAGVGCDARGRVIDLQLKYPNVPASLPDTLVDIVSLHNLQISGNSSVPTGSFPRNLLTLQNLTKLDLEYTALTGPLSDVDFSKSGLNNLYLVNNKGFGNGLPDLSNAQKLSTLAITGQDLHAVDEAKLPKSLTYLDLSYNALTGSIPSFSSLTNLQTLYLTNNALTQPPPSLPPSLSTLSLTGNPDLSGTISPLICNMTGLNTCDLRGTKLMGGNVTQVLDGNVTITTPGKVCGRCVF